MPRRVSKDRSPWKVTKSIPYPAHKFNRGGFALVWLAKKLNTGERVALKQIAKKNAKDCMQKEIHFGQTLFEEDGIPRAEFEEYPGIKSSHKL